MQMSKAWMLICLTLLCSAEVFAAAEARLDRTRIAEGETVVLILNSTDDGGGMPDVSPLAKDFDLLSSSQSMQMSMINGRSSSSRGWQFVLGPKRTGKLAVPAIRIGGATTKPLELEVLPAAQAAELGPAPPVVLEAEVEPKRPFVQQKVIYTVRLLSRVPLRQPRISEPQIADAIVEPLGRQTEYSSQRDGQQYRVTERRYAVFPQRSGSLQIDGPVLAAQLPEQNQRGGQRYPGRDMFGDFDRLFGPGGFPNSSSLFGQTRPLRLRAATQTLDVQPQPAGSPSPWLPAESLTLNDAWSKDPPQLRVGEPITRSVVITAQGLSAAQLPDLEPEAPTGIKVYPDKAESQARVDGDTLVAQKVLKFALVPERSGSLRLPEIRVAWWDVAKQQPREARLPAREVTVLPGAAGSPAPANSAAPWVGSQPSAPTARPPFPPRAAAEPSAVGADRDDAVGMSYWPWVVAILALAWLATTALWLRARRAHAVPGVGAPAAPQTVAASPKPGRALAAIEQACRSDDPAAARQALLEWAAVRWPEEPPRRLDSLIPRLGGEVAPVLHALDRSLYAQATQPWDGAAAWQVLSAALTRLDRTKSAMHKDGALPPLYPQGS